MTSSLLLFPIMNHLFNFNMYRRYRFLIELLRRILLLILTVVVIISKGYSRHFTNDGLVFMAYAEVTLIIALVIIYILSLFKYLDKYNKFPV